MEQKIIKGAVTMEIKNEPETYRDSKMLQINSEHRLRQENLAFDIDCWYPLVSQFTAETVFLPISKREALAVVRHYKEWVGIVSKKGDTTRFGVEDQMVLMALENRISTKLFELGTPAFFRLCGRSPKDSLIDIPREDFERILQEKKDSNEAIQEVTMRNMKIQSSKDVLRLLLTSERMYADMLDYLEFGEPEQIVLRKWVPDMKMGMEFRVFVKDAKITG